MTPLFDKFISHIIVQESVTFSVADSTTTVATLGDLSWILNNQFHQFMLKNLNIPLEKYPDELRGENIVVDGDSDYFGNEGVLSIYTDKVPEELTTKLIQMISYYVGENNAEVLNKPYVETSGSRKGDVWRLRVKVNPVDDNPPEMNLSNLNAKTLMCDILNYSDDVMTEYPSIQANELLMKIEQIEDNDYQLDKAVRPETQDGNHYQGGLSKERIKQVLDNLKAICEWALERDYTYIQLS